MSKTQTTKPLAAPKPAKQNRQRFYYIRTKGRYGMLSAKAENLNEALKIHGIRESDVAESRELSTNRHGAIVEFCDIVDAIPEVKEVALRVPLKPATVKQPEKVTVPAPEVTAPTA
jgi:hypothetical protein